MPKRKNPFGEITPLQRKTHVGFQEMATEQDKQLVHGKSGLTEQGLGERPSRLTPSHDLPVARTKALLFRGANPEANLDGAFGPALPSGRHHTHQRMCHNSDCELSELPTYGGNGLHLLPHPPPLSNGWGSHTNLPVAEVACGPSRTQGGILSFFSQPVTARVRHAPLQGGGGGRREGPPHLCHGCRQSVVGMGRCAHCEQEVCDSCLRCCCVCQALYCPFCSVLK